MSDVSQFVGVFDWETYFEGGSPGGGSADFSAVAEDILPDADGTYDLGSALKGFAEIWFGGGVRAMAASGWVPADAMAYTSADAPSFVATITGDKTANYSAGMRVKLTQTTVKYFIITKVALNGGNTELTLYGGTDYVLANAAITLPFFSVVKAPTGFPMSPTKWTEEALPIDGHSYDNSAVDTTWRPFQDFNSPNANFALSIPIGAWRVSHSGGVLINGPTGACDARITLSSTTNTETEARFTRYFNVDVSVIAPAESFYASHELLLTSKTTYTLLRKVLEGATTNINLLDNDYAQASIRAVCAYL